MEIIADLHAHSRASDGLLTPAEVVRLAAANGVTLFALTDHDELSGIAEAKAAARSAEMGFLSGVEISVSWREHTLHVVGLGIDETAAPLCEGLAGLRKSREQRACRIAQELGRFGVEDALKGALQSSAARTSPGIWSKSTGHGT